MADIETTFTVTLRSENLGESRARQEPERHARNLLRALHNSIGVGYSVCDADGAGLAYDPKADDMGNHPGHDEIVSRR